VFLGHQERSGLLYYFLLKLQPVDTGLKLLNGLLLRRERFGGWRNAPRSSCNWVTQRRNKLSPTSRDLAASGQL